MSNEDELLDWLIKQQQIVGEEQMQTQIDSQVVEVKRPVIRQVKNDYEEFNNSCEKQSCLLNILSGFLVVDQQMERFLYRRIDPHQTVKRPFYSLAPSVSPFARFYNNRIELGKLVDYLNEQELKRSRQGTPSVIQSKIKNKNYSLHLGCVPNSSQSTFRQSRVYSKPQSSYNTSRVFSLQNTTATTFITHIRPKQQGNKIAQFQDEDEQMPEDYCPRKITVEHVQPPKYHRIKEKFRWWPLEDLQKFLVKKMNEDSDDEDTIPKKEVEIDRGKSRQSAPRRKLSVGNDNTQNIIKKCNNYLNESKTIQRELKSKEISFNIGIDAINLDEEATQERQYELERKRYEEQEFEDVNNEFKSRNGRKRGVGKLFRKEFEHRKHISNQKLLEYIQGKLFSK